MALTVPKLPVEPPQVPPLPQLPDLPTGPAPSLPQVTTPKLPSTPQLQQAPSLPSRGGGAPATGTTPAGGSAPPAPGATAPAGSNGSPSPGAPQRGGTSSSSPSSANRGAARPSRQERHFRRAARQLEPCLFALSGFDRRVIVLRGGYGGREPLSRAGVARRLKTSVRRVRRAESRGLRTLRTVRHTQGCLGSQETAVAVLTAPAESGGAPALIASDGDGAAELEAVADKRRLPNGGKGEVLAAHDSKPKKRSTPSKAAVIRPVNEASSGPPLGIALGLVLLVFAVVGVSMVMFARRRSSPTAPEAAAAAPAAPVAAPPAPVAAPPAPPAVPPPVAELPPPWAAEPPPAPADRPAPTQPAEEPAAEAPEPAGAPELDASPDHSGRNRTAIGVAASVASVAAGYLLRRRRR